MSSGLERLAGKVRRRRRRYYIFAVITVVALVLAGIVGYMIYGASEAGFAAVQSSLFLTFAVLLLFLIPTRDMRRIESIIYLASKHGGTLKIETIRKELRLPDEKSKALLGWMEKQKMAEEREQTGRWVFPELRRSREGT
ncbi:MAG: hypothetical protein ACE5H4_11030 [Candidatus Thorarchaeota archaeon]